MNKSNINKPYIKTKTTKKTKNQVSSKKTKTFKKRTNLQSRNSAIIKSYLTNYSNSDLLPVTEIINFINVNHNTFMIEKEEKEALKLDPFTLQDFFIHDEKLTTPEDSTNIQNLTINQKPDVSLDKLLAYSLYKSEYNKWFNAEQMNVSLFKDQIGKDFLRLNVIINNQENVGRNRKEKETNSNVTDNFYIKLMQIISKFSIIDLNLINKFGICACQNIFNFITDMLSVEISKKIQPEIIQLTKATKNVSINLTQNEQLYILNFDSKFWITKDRSIYDPEATCGNLKFSFLIDFKKNTYQIKDFNLNYDTKTCYQENSQNNSSTEENSEESSQNNSKKKNKKIDYSKYAIPISIGVGGIIATPFLLGVLGGKKEKRKTKKIKTNKKK